MSLKEWLGDSFHFGRVVPMFRGYVCWVQGRYVMDFIYRKFLEMDGCIYKNECLKESAGWFPVSNLLGC